MDRVDERDGKRENAAVIAVLVLPAGGKRGNWVSV